MTAETGIAPRSLAEARELAKEMAVSKLLPNALQKAPADVLLIVMTGAELGLGPMQSIRGIAIVQGKPTMSADTMAALVMRRRDVCTYLRLVESSAQVATYETQRAGHPQPTRLTWSIEQARAAGLAGKGTWQQYPDAMLRARCLAAICRAVYPDLVAGVYDPDELGTAPAPLPAPVSPVATDPTPQPTPAPVAEPTEAEWEAPASAAVVDVDDTRRAMESAADYPTLREVGRRVQALPDGAEKDGLRTLYAERARAFGRRVQRAVAP